MQKLKIRNLISDDLDVVQGIHSSNCKFPFPDLSNQLYCCNKVVEDEKGNVVGIGIVRLTSESILIMNRSHPVPTRAKAVKLLVDQLRSEVKSLGMDETHAFIDEEDSKLKRLLKKAFGFIECYTKPIYLQF